MVNDQDLIKSPIPQAEVGAARIVVRACRVATLATANSGQPHTALVTPACLPDGSILLLLSELSRHTAQLRGNPSCSLLCLGTPPVGEPNPQATPRVSLACTAMMDRSEVLLARFLALHSYARLYAAFADFALWRLRVEGIHFVGGFARAWSAKGADYAPATQAVETIAGAEADIVAHCNQDHGAAMALIGQAGSGVAGGWELTAVDVDGCNLMWGERGTYIPWPQPVADVRSLRQAVVELSRRAREICRDDAAKAGASGASHLS